MPKGKPKPKPKGKGKKKGNYKNWAGKNGPKPKAKPKPKPKGKRKYTKEEKEKRHEMIANRRPPNTAKSIWTDTHHPFGKGKKPPAIEFPNSEKEYYNIASGKRTGMDAIPRLTNILGDKKLFHQFIPMSPNSKAAKFLCETWYDLTDNDKEAFKTMYRNQHNL